MVINVLSVMRWGCVLYILQNLEGTSPCLSPTLRTTYSLKTIYIIFDNKHNIYFIIYYFNVLNVKYRQTVSVIIDLRPVPIPYFIYSLLSVFFM